MADEDLSPLGLKKGLASTDDSIRKRAAFRLQSQIGDPSFTDQFIAEDGLENLQYLAKSAGGNTLAYTLASFSTILELDQGWEYVDSEVITRLLQFVVAQPLVNILRGAMAILAAVVSHPPQDLMVSGVTALNPALAQFPTFLDMLVSRLSASDHGLCANSLQLINALMRDSFTNGTDEESETFVKRMKDLGAIKAVYTLMQGSGLQDLAGPLLDFQTLMKMLLRKWRERPVDVERPEHKRLMKLVYLAANPERRRNKMEDTDSEVPPRNRDPEKWRRIGFENSHPADEFADSGFLGLLDLTDYIRASEEGFRRLLLEQSIMPIDQRCPVAKASSAVSVILYDHFEIERSEVDQAHQSGGNYEKAFKPTLLQWPRLHTAGLQAFFRLWTATSARAEDFSKIEELVRILIEQVVGSANRTQDVSEVEQELANFDLRELRKLQMDLLELTHEDVWGGHLRSIKDDLRHEALHFMKEQRIRCLLQGAWFSNLPAISKPSDASPEAPADTRTPSWRFARLSHNRKTLHWMDFEVKPNSNPTLDEMTSRISMSSVTEVRSEVSSSSAHDDLENGTSDTESILTVRSPLDSVRGDTKKDRQKSTTTTIIVRGHAGTNTSHTRNHSRTNSRGKAMASVKSQKSSRETNNIESETSLLTLHPTTSLIASEWLDGLMMLLDQAPITSETTKLVTFVSRYGLKIRMLNVKFGEGGVGAGLDEWGSAKEVELPTREGLDEDYYYEIPGTV